MVANLFLTIKRMFNFCLPLVGASLDPATSSTLDPIYDFIDIFGPVLIGILLGVAIIYCIALGVQYSRSESSDERNAIKKKIVNAAVGFGTIIILIVILYGLRVPLINWINE